VSPACCAHRQAAIALDLPRESMTAVAGEKEGVS